MSNDENPIEIDDNIQQYNKQLKRFFQMKTNWENTKNKNRGVKCPICNNITKKMNFEISHDLYLAECGKKICPKLEIPRRTYTLFDDKIQQMTDKLANLQRKFIIEKMDSMFKFIENKNTIKEFKADLEEYRELRKLLDEQTNDNNYQKHNEQIDVLNSQIFIELQKIKEIEKSIPTSTSASKLIDDIIQITTTKLIPLTIELQNTKYPIMEMNIRKNGELYLYQRDELAKFITI
jgi:paraquat-inducible protein B